MAYSVANTFDQFLDAFKSRHGSKISTAQGSALNAVLGCRTAQYGTITLKCPECAQRSMRGISCGHRFCTQCQHHTTTEWLERQAQKLLQVSYFMVTFTLPYELRKLAEAQAEVVYHLMFQCAVKTLRSFGVRDKALNAKLAMTGVLHTHNRRLEYHPHVHFVVPGGGISEKQRDKKKYRQWCTVKGKYLFNHFNLACVFRGKLIAALEEEGLEVPDNPKDWVADCRHVGAGLPALKYLSKYLYRGVISDKQIIKVSDTHVTFSYTDSETKKTRQRCLLGEDFMLLLLQHVLPTGFRRARDYGFLHGNAKRLLHFVQQILRVMLPRIEPKERPRFKCPKCATPMTISNIRLASSGSG